VKVNQSLKPRRYQGAFVYKYRSVERLRAILLENRLYFPKARDLNDPEEARPPLAASSAQALIVVMNQLNATAKPFLTNQGLARDAAIIDFNVRRLGNDRCLSLMRRALDKFSGRFRIYSLSKRRDSLHLWKEYAGDHTGYCLEFRTEESFGPIFEVRYGDIALDITGPEQFEPYFLFYKTKSWQKEEEVRMIKQQNSDSTSTFDPRLLTRLILGSEIVPTDAATIRAWAGDRELPLTIVSELDITPK
jgi:Protein of unknown function (DUF2971)